MKWDEYVDIFDTDVVSKIIILRNLPINEGWIDINELAEELQLNKKSVKKYVELLKDDITYYAVDLMELCQRQQSIIPVMPRFGACSKGLQKF